MRSFSKIVWVVGFLALGITSESFGEMLMPVAQTTTRVSVRASSFNQVGQPGVNPVGVGVGVPLPGQGQPGQPMGPGGPMMGNHGGPPCGGGRMYGGGCGRPQCGGFRGRGCGPRACGGGGGVRFRRAMHCGGGGCGGGRGIRVSVRIGGFGRCRRC